MIALIPWFQLEGIRIPLPLGFSIPIQPFGVLAALAILVGSWVAQRRARVCGVPEEQVSRFIAVTVPIGLLSAMLLNVLLYEPSQWRAMGRAITSWFSTGPALPFPYPGLSSFGGFFGAMLAAFYFRQRKRISLLIMSDLLCYALPFAWLIARTGCFVVHDHPGVMSDFALAVDNYRGSGVPRHDLGLYEVLWSACMIPLLLVLAGRRRPWGFYTAFVSIAYAPVRFGLDFLRAPVEQGGDVRYLGFTPAQYAALLLFLVGAAVAMRTLRKPQPELELERAQVHQEWVPSLGKQPHS